MMQIDPDRFTFSDIENYAETPEVRERFERAVAEGKIVAVADQVRTLQKLQNDLDRVGYVKKRI